MTPPERCATPPTSAPRVAGTAPPAANMAEVDLCMRGGAYFLYARFSVSMSGVEREVIQALVNEAHQTCPYSKVTRGNIDVAINPV
jgi:lipoyl-dependent peroxiredoxin